MIVADRREFIFGGGLAVLFASTGLKAAALPGSLAQTPLLDAWIHIAPDGRATVFTGKVELGQGIRTALFQIAADELEMAEADVTLVTADTGRTPNEGFTAGSHTIQDSGSAIANAAANVRLLLTEEAGRQWSLPVGRLRTRLGTVVAPDGRTIGYGPLAQALDLHVAARPEVPRKTLGARRLVGANFARTDIPAKLTGGAAYVHDLRMERMLHARVVRGPAEGTRLLKIDPTVLGRLPGVEHVVRQGRFLALAGPREWPLQQALQTISDEDWEAIGPARPQGVLADAIKALPSRDSVIVDRGDAPANARSLSASYSRPYLLHGSIGPSCAVALYENGMMTVWTHAQGVYPLRRAIAELLRLPPEKVRCIHVEGAGCYGHNGADDVAADAALVALSLPGRPIRMQWSRAQEHGWEPAGPAMVTELQGELDAGGRIAALRLDVWSNSHATRPMRAGDLVAGSEIEPAFVKSPPIVIPQPEGGGDRNAVPLYEIPAMRITNHFLPDMPIRVSSLRALGAHLNIFAIESFMDELAAAGRSDPVAFRLAHMRDARARAVIMEAARRFKWRSYRPKPLRGAGFAFARYKNLGAFCAIALDVEIERETGRPIVHRAVAAVDCGEAVNPDGVRNQIEGGIVQSLSWTGQEALAFDTRSRTAFDWGAYPILRFSDAPRAVEVIVLDQPGQAFLGVGEAAQGPAAAAFANAVATAAGRRIRDMPLSMNVIKAALGA